MSLDFSKLQKVDQGVYIKRGSLFKYRLIYPIKNEDGSMNWFNLFTGGDYGNLIMITLICLMIIGSVFAYRHDVKVLYTIAKQCVELPCKWCDEMTRMTGDTKLNINYSALKVAFNISTTP